MTPQSNGNGPDGDGEPGERIAAADRERPGESRAIPKAPPPRKRRRWLWPVILLVLVAVIAAVAFYYVRAVAPYETTDDAFVEGHVTFVSPRVAGPVTRVLVDDNQEVKAGALLVEIDPRDYETRVTQARADLAAARGKAEEARAQITVAEANLQQRTAAIAASEAEARRAEADLKRFQSTEAAAISQSQLDLAQSQARSANANLQASQSLHRAAEAQVSLSRATAETAAAEVQQAQSALEQAELNLSYTRVVAPVAGHVTRRTVEQGAFVQTGQALLAIVPHDVWVVANFKETQIKDMRVGQPVNVEVDAFSKREFRAKIDSIQSGTGSRFSLLPPENAVGNYVKVVQRVPVKIVFDEGGDAIQSLAPGMSVTPKVRVK